MNQHHVHLPFGRASAERTRPLLSARVTMTRADQDADQLAALWRNLADLHPPAIENSVWSASHVQGYLAHKKQPFPRTLK